MAGGAETNISRRCPPSRGGAAQMRYVRAI